MSGKRRVYQAQARLTQVPLSLLGLMCLGWWLNRLVDHSKKKAVL